MGNVEFQTDVYKFEGFKKAKIIPGTWYEGARAYFLVSQ